MPKLTMPREESLNKLKERISALEAIKQIPLTNAENVKRVALKMKNWDDYSVVLLNKMFDQELFAKKLVEKPIPFDGDASTVKSIGLGFYIEHTINHLLYRNSEIESIIEQLDLFDEPTNTQQPTKQKNQLGEDVFIVHGHDTVAKLDVARTVEQLNYNAIILHERANKGRTVIEKLIEESTNAGFAIILLTPDDVGAIKGSSDVEERARQNVVLELGYFIGKLGRTRVCVLLKGNTQIPSDFKGVVYIPMDNGGKWKYDLAKELQSVGFTVDLTRIT